MRGTLVGHYISYLAWFIVRLLFHTCVEVFKSMVIVCFPRDNETPLKDKPSATVSISKFIHGIISLDDVKVVKNAMNIDTDHGEHKIKARWIPTKVKVEDHVVVPNIDQNIENLDQFLEYYTTNKAISPMGKSKALWEFHLLVLEKHATQGITYFRSPKEKKCDARLLGITLVTCFGS
ncbi:hypothetical protein YC2023_085061 [Brassica napus]